MARQQRDRRQELTLEKAVMHLLEECRMVLPGIQMTFGFQLIVVFNSPSGNCWTPPSSGCTSWPSRRWPWLPPWSCPRRPFIARPTPWKCPTDWSPPDLPSALGQHVPLAIGLCIDLYLLATVILRNSWGLPYAAVLFLALISLWYLLPLASRLTRGPQPSRIPPAEKGK